MSPALKFRLIEGNAEEHAPAEVAPPVSLAPVFAPAANAPGPEKAPEVTISAIEIHDPLGNDAADSSAFRRLFGFTLFIHAAIVAIAMWSSPFGGARATADTDEATFIEGISVDIVGGVPGDGSGSLAPLSVGTLLDSATVTETPEEAAAAAKIAEATATAPEASLVIAEESLTAAVEAEDDDAAARFDIPEATQLTSEAARAAPPQSGGPLAESPGEQAPAKPATPVNEPVARPGAMAPVAATPSSTIEAIIAAAGPEAEPVQSRSTRAQAVVAASPATATIARPRLARAIARTLPAFATKASAAGQVFEETPAIVAETSLPAAMIPVADATATPQTSLSPTGRKIAVAAALAPALAAQPSEAPAAPAGEPVTAPAATSPGATDIPQPVTEAPPVLADNTILPPTEAPPQTAATAPTAISAALARPAAKSASEEPAPAPADATAPGSANPLALSEPPRPAPPASSPLSAAPADVEMQPDPLVLAYAPLPRPRPDSPAERTAKAEIAKAERAKAAAEKAVKTAAARAEKSVAARRAAAQAARKAARAVPPAAPPAAASTPTFGDPQSAFATAQTGAISPTPGTFGSGGQNSDARGAVSASSYQSTLLARLRRFRSYPPEARRQRIRGTATVTFTVNTSGSLVSVSLVGGSGSAILDREALAMVRRASPFPPIPANLGRSQVTVQSPIRFDVR
ncbi:MAG: TonB family protein [Bauldia sp.]